MISFISNIKRHFSSKEIAIVLLAIIVLISGGAGVFLGLKKEVIINDNGKTIIVKTMKSTVKDVLKQSGVNVSDYDYVSMPLNARLQKKNNIIIKRAVPINVEVDGQQVKLMTYWPNVKEAIANSSIKLGANDRIEGANPEDAVKEGMNIKIVRVKEELVTEQVSIPFNTIRRENDYLDKNVEQVIREGEDGIKEEQYKVVYENGKEISRELVKESILKNPIDKIIEFGTVLMHNTARGGTIRYSKVLDMISTAYTSSYKDTGKDVGDPGFGITSTGIKAQKGVIAVDPNVIPLGTRVYVEVAGNTPDYGYAVAADTGGGIKGNLIDLYFENQYEADNWGYKRVKVYFLIE